MCRTEDVFHSMEAENLVRDLLHLSALNGLQPRDSQSPRDIIQYLLTTKYQRRNQKEIKTENTPLHIVCQYQANELIALLCSNHVLISPRNKLGDSPLHMTCQSGNLEGTQLLLEHRAQIHARNKEKLSPLHIASSFGHCNIVKYLLQHGARMDLRDKHGNTPFLVACTQNQLEVAVLLHEHRADIYARNFVHQYNGFQIACQMGWLQLVKWYLSLEKLEKLLGVTLETPLHLSCAGGHLDVSQLLLEHGALPNKPNKLGNTSLHVTCSRGYHHLASILISYGAAVMAVNRSGETPLHLACKSGSIELVTLLLQYPVDIFCRNSVGESPFHFVNGQHAEKIAQLLIERGADVNDFARFTPARQRRKSSLHTPLLAGCISGNIGYVAFLLKHGADANRKDPWGSNSPVRAACQIGSIPLLSLLLDYGADIDSATTSGNSVTIACLHDNHELLAFLADHGADLESRNYGGETPLHLACSSNQLWIVNYLAEKGVDVNPQTKYGSTPLHIAVRHGNIDIVSALLHHKCQVNIENQNGQTPLYLAVTDPRMVKLLIENGTNVNPHSKVIGETPLHRACKCSTKEIIQYLLENGADVNAQSTTVSRSSGGFTSEMRGVTPLHIVCASPRLEIASLLLAFGADVNCQTESLDTPLHCACLTHLSTKNIDLIILLLEAGARTNLPNARSRYPLDSLLHWNNFAAVEYILEKDISSRYNPATLQQRNVPVELQLKLRYHQYRRSWLYFLYGSHFLSQGRNPRSEMVLASSDLYRYITEYM